MEEEKNEADEKTEQPIKKINWDFVYGVLYTVFIVVGIILSFVIGRWTVADELNVLMEYQRNNPHTCVNESGFFVSQNEDQPNLNVPFFNGSGGN